MKLCLLDFLSQLLTITSASIGVMCLPTGDMVKRENGANPLRGRRCDRPAPRTLLSHCRDLYGVSDGKALRGVLRAVSQKTCLSSEPLSCFGLEQSARAVLLCGLVPKPSGQSILLLAEPARMDKPMRHVFSARVWALAGMILLAALSRLVPHPPNFTPLAAMALFGAANFDRKWEAFLVPFAAMLLSDVGLEILHRLGLSASWGFHPLMGVVYGTFGLITTMGLLLRGRVRLSGVAFAVVSSSVIFFVVTNFAVWALSADGPLPGGYPKTLAGLVECYGMALPFFHWTLLGDLTYSTALFGGFAVLTRAFPALGRLSVVQA